VLRDDDIRVVLRAEASRVRVPVDELRERIRRADVQPERPGLWQRLRLAARLEAAAACLVLGLVVFIGSSRAAPQAASLHDMLRSQPPGQVTYTVRVRNGETPLSGMIVTVVELAVKARTSVTGDALFTLPVSGNEGIYTFAVTPEAGGYTTYIRERISPTANLMVIPFDGRRQVFRDNAKPGAPVQPGPIDAGAPGAKTLLQFAEAVTGGRTAAAAELLAPTLRGVAQLNDFAALRNTPVMEVISLEERAWQPDLGARDQKVAEAHVFEFVVRYKVLGLTDSSFADGETYRHKATVVRFTAEGPWQITELSGRPR